MRNSMKNRVAIAAAATTGFVAKNTGRTQTSLGLPRLTWSGNPMIPLVDHVATAAAAVHAGLCETVLVYHAAYRAAWNTGSALKDPFRRIATPSLNDPQPGPETMAAGVGYT